MAASNLVLSHVEYAANSISSHLHREICEHETDRLSTLHLKQQSYGTQIASDQLTKLAEANWSSAALAKQPPPKFQPKIVDDIYSKELHGDKDEPPTLKRIMVLEISQFLENYLWPHFDADKASAQHVMAIAVMVNEKFRENVPAWAGLSEPGTVSGLLAPNILRKCMMRF